MSILHLFNCGWVLISNLYIYMYIYIYIYISQSKSHKEWGDIIRNEYSSFSELLVSFDVSHIDIKLKDLQWIVDILLEFEMPLWKFMRVGNS